jgi:hypothetical protein
MELSRVHPLQTTTPMACIPSAQEAVFILCVQFMKDGLACVCVASASAKESEELKTPMHKHGR